MQANSGQTKTITCLRENCKRKAAKTKEGLQLFDCETHLSMCFWLNCKRKKTTSWLCRLHFLAKEANYGLNDTDPKNTEVNKQPGGDFYQWGVERLRNFALYVIDEAII